jgi:hypothetical protein
MTARLNERDIAAFEPEAKIGLLATVDPEGRPHLTLITSLRAKTPTQLMFGQFTEGRSKAHLADNPHVGFLVMNAEREVWRGTARWTHSAQEGEDYVLYNQQPMFRYNTYFGVHTVHYLDLVDFAGTAQLALPRIVAGSLATKLAGGLHRPARPILKPWARSHIAALGTLKFLACVGEDGFPRIIPVVPTYPAGNRLLFAPTVYRSELEAIGRGTSVAVLALNLQMESVLVRGTFTGFRRVRGVRAGAIDLDWVYNSMPPLPGQVYPEVPLQAVEQF